MKPFPGCVQSLSGVVTPPVGLDGRVLSRPHGQAVFFRELERYGPE